MDANIDLTTGRDFRHRYVSPSVPRSIFHKNKETHMHPVINNSYVTGMDFGVGTNVFFDMNNITMGPTYIKYTYNGINSNSGYQMQEDDTCDRCGADISRIPWYKDIYYSLCKSCATSYMEKRIPWK